MRKRFALIAWSLFMHHAVAQQIVPLPQKTVSSYGDFAITPQVIIVTDSSFLEEATFLQNEINIRIGSLLPIANRQTTQKNTIYLKKESSATAEESYRLNVTPSAITILAGDRSGAFYGCISLLQLIPLPDAKTAGSNPIHVPAVSITDFPQYKWRGLMLDLSRTFMPPSYLKKTITRMAFYKMNVLHLHLTDDQGWRIPIKGYPLLTEKASKFDSTYHEPAEFQGFYTQEDIAELHRHATKMHVQLVPEIESPGHSHAALYAYPELLCTHDISPIRPFITGMPTINDVFCVGNPSSLQFFQTVVSETSAMFPSEYLHLGGDEVPRTYWEKCPKCQSLTKAEGLSSTGKLQGYFMQKLRDEAVRNGKRPVAWDEILEENEFLTKDWVIMSWRGVKPGQQAAAKGFDVVMTPTSHLYFDYGYDATNSKKIFEFDPLEGSVTNPDSIGKHILGIQANFWSHIDRTQTRIDYQLFPRLLSVAERAWSAADNQNYQHFKNRLLYHKNWLDYFDIKYFHDDF